MGKEDPKDRLEMVSRQPTWAKKGPRIDWKWFQGSQLGPRKLQGWNRDGCKTANLGQEGSKDRREMVSGQPTWAKKAPRQTRDGFKTASLGQEGPKDRPEMVSRWPTWAKKVARIDYR